MYINPLWSYTAVVLSIIHKKCTFCSGEQVTEHEERETFCIINSNSFLNFIDIVSRLEILLSRSQEKTSKVQNIRSLVTLLKLSFMYIRTCNYM